MGVVWAMHMSFLARKLYTALHRAQVNTRSPANRRLLNRVIAMTLPPRLACSEQGEKHLGELERDGFTRLGKPFDEAALRRLKQSLSTKLCVDAWHIERGMFRLEDTPAETNNARLVGVESIPESLAIANDPNILSIVSHYLGCRPTIEHILAWWSIAGRPAPIEEQFFHRDNPSVRFLKLFVYLSDVSDTDGPHVFIRGSQRTNELLAPSRRFKDQDVFALAGKDRVVRFTGSFGTAFLEDTFGLHRGEVPQTSDRLIFQVTYSTMPEPSSFAEARNADISGYDRYINRLLSQR